MKIFCIGIGGIGLSALARYYKSQGHTVSGSDMSETELTKTLQDEGIEIFIGTDMYHITDNIDEVVYTIAIPESHPEFLQAKKFGIVCKTYAEALGEVTKEKKTIAVSGTHGKTTTTAMMYHAMKECGINPTVIIGSLIGGTGTNFIHGDSEYMIVEACEYRRSFLNLFPEYLIVTNVDADHLDYYKDLYDIKSAFQSFAEKIPASGFLVTHKDLSFETVCKKINADSINADEIELSVLGKHNQSNAQLVLAVINALGLDEVKARAGLRKFKGTWRRLEYKGEYKGASFYDDYGHHPTEIKATLEAIREKYPDGLNATGKNVASSDHPKGGLRKFKLVVVFQPHLYSRTRLLFNDFINSFTLADKILILPIYAAREDFDSKISSHDLVENINNSIYMQDLEEVKKYIDDKCHSGSVVITIGAGDVYKLHNLFEKESVLNLGVIPVKTGI